jgi:hypothetical protein
LSVYVAAHGRAAETVLAGIPLRHGHAGAVLDAEEAEARGHVFEADSVAERLKATLPPLWRELSGGRELELTVHVVKASHQARALYPGQDRTFQERAAEFVEGGFALLVVHLLAGDGGAAVVSTLGRPLAYRVLWLAAEAVAGQVLAGIRAGGGYVPSGLLEAAKSAATKARAELARLFAPGGEVARRCA